VKGHGERQGAHAVRRLQRDLLSDRAAHRDAQQVEAVELELVGERQRVTGHVGDLVLAGRHRGLADVPVVEDHGAVLRREGLDLGDPGERVAGEAVHAEERIALPDHLVVEPLPVHLCDGHAGSLHPALAGQPTC
jgi:hypothetical protein